ncbi:unnamed protein product, partial [Protopolystoma xenopodis]
MSVGSRIQEDAPLCDSPCLCPAMTRLLVVEPSSSVASFDETTLLASQQIGIGRAFRPEPMMVFRLEPGSAQADTNRLITEENTQMQLFSVF